MEVKSARPTEGLRGKKEEKGKWGNQWPDQVERIMMLFAEMVRSQET